jgi:hypothetical protein
MLAQSAPGRQARLALSGEHKRHSWVFGQNTRICLTVFDLHDVSYLVKLYSAMQGNTAVRPAGVGGRQEAPSHSGGQTAWGSIGVLGIIESITEVTPSRQKPFPEETSRHTAVSNTLFVWWLSGSLHLTKTW